MADPSPVHVGLDIPRADIESAIKAALDMHVKAATDEAIRTFKSEINGALDDTTDKLSSARAQILGLDDQLRGEEEKLRKKIDDLEGRIKKASDEAETKLKALENDVNAKATRYLLPLALVIITGIVLGGFSIFGGFKAQDRITQITKDADVLGGQVTTAQKTFDTTKGTLDTLTKQLDQATTDRIIAANALLKENNDALKLRVDSLQKEVEVLQGAAGNGTSGKGSTKGSGASKKKTN